jgi:hypothetical protein
MDYKKMNHTTHGSGYGGVMPSGGAEEKGGGRRGSEGKEGGEGVQLFDEHLDDDAFLEFLNEWSDSIGNSANVSMKGNSANVSMKGNSANVSLKGERKEGGSGKGGAERGEERGGEKGLERQFKSENDDMNNDINNNRNKLMNYSMNDDNYPDRSVKRKSAERLPVEKYARNDSLLDMELNGELNIKLNG